jgi:hypothetical protein
MNPPPDEAQPAPLLDPDDVDNSNGGHIWVPANKGKWGPFEGRMLYLSYGKSSLFAVLQERVGDIAQGGVVKFPLKFATGLMRARFDPADGQLYVSGLKGLADQRREGRRHPARPLHRQVRHARRRPSTSSKQGITVALHRRARTRRPPPTLQNRSHQQYNDLCSGAYGSGTNTRSASPTEKGAEPGAESSSVRLADDGKTVFLEVPGLVPATADAHQDEREGRRRLAAMPGRHRA